MQQSENKYTTAVEGELTAVMKMIETQFDKDYAKKNPDMVRHLMDKVQEHKYIEIKLLENSPPKK